MLISAPAGFGKTTLLSDWIHVASGNGGKLSKNHLSQPGRESNSRFCWISLEESDNDTARFFSYFIAALQTVEPALGKDLFDPNSGLQLPKAESFLHSLINELAEVRIPTVLVLDDFHVIETQEIHDTLNHLIAHLPPSIHLVIATRADPPLHLARLRARGQLIEIRQTDLRFTAEEIAAFFQSTHGLELSADQVAALAARTEGWVAGLHLAALALPPAGTAQHQAASANFIESFSGSSRFVLDYLMEEVLSRQSEELQLFLLATSVLDRLCSSLCDALLVDCLDRMHVERFGATSEPANRSVSQSILEYLERANLFVLPLDNQRRWYRYHHLFAELLRQRLDITRPVDPAELHRRASLWFEQNLLLPEAIEHALAAQDYERAVELVEAAAEATLTRSEMTIFLGWMDSLPDPLVRNRPYLCLYHACALLLNSRGLEKIEARLRDAQRDNLDPAVQMAVSAFNSFLVGFRDAISDFAPGPVETLEVIPEKNQFLRSLVAVFQCFTYTFFESLANSIPKMEEAARISREASNWLGYIIVRSQIGDLLAVQGKLHAAEKEYQQILNLIDPSQSNPYPVIGLAYIGKAEVLREWNELDLASQYLQQGVGLIEGWGEVNTFDAHIIMARIKLGQGDFPAAVDQIEQAAQHALGFDVSTVDDRYAAAVRAKIWTIQGNLAAASQWMRENNLDQAFTENWLPENGSLLTLYILGMECLSLARLRLALGQAALAQQILTPLLQKFEKQDLIRFLIEGLLLQALACRTHNDEEGVFAALERALALAEPEHYLRIFLDEGPSMRECLQAAAPRLKDERLKVYVIRLLAAFESSDASILAARSRQLPVVQPETSTGQLGPEPLSEREIEALTWIAAGLSNQEIADRMVVALSTVKTHVHNIYQKLGVTSRTMAIARARELELI